MTPTALLRPALAAAMLAPLAAGAQEPSPVGRWENTHTGMVLEFRTDGRVDMAGIGTSSFAMCADAGGNICVNGPNFSCRYRVKFTGESMDLQLFTGRPTKFCPEGVFRRAKG